MQLTIIIPVYNSKKTILRCLNSTLNDFLDYEVIIIDDGSIDESCNIIKDFIKDKRNYHYFFEKNSGVSSARNFGINKAHGDYILFLDSDDFLVNFNKINIFNYLKGDIVIFKYKKEKQHFFSKPKLCNKTIDISKECFYKNYYYKFDYMLNYVWGKFIKRSIIIENNLCFDEKINYGEDALFFSECVLHSNSISIINYIIYSYNNCDKLGKLSYLNHDGEKKFFYISEKIYAYANINSINSNNYYLSNLLKFYEINDTKFLVQIPKDLKVSLKYKKFYKLCLNNNQSLHKYVKKKKQKEMFISNLKKIAKRFID